MLYLGDVMGAEGVKQCVKWLLVFWTVDFGKLFHCFLKFSVQLGGAGHSVAVYSETKKKNLKETNNSSVFMPLFITFLFA